MDCSHCILEWDDLLLAFGKGNTKDTWTLSSARKFTKPYFIPDCEVVISPLVTGYEYLFPFAEKATFINVLEKNQSP